MLMKHRARLWPDVCYLELETKLVKTPTCFLYEDRPFRLDRVAPGRLVTVSFWLLKHSSVFAEKPILLSLCQQTPSI